MFGVDEIVVYGSTGVCRIVDVGTPEFHGVDRSQSYYTLKPVFGEGVIYCPTENSRVFIRAVISRERAEQLLESIPSVHAQAYHNRSTQMLTEHYNKIISSHDCADLIELILSIYHKKQALALQKRRLGQVDERFMKRAQNLLYGELAVALGTEKEEMERCVSEKIKHIEKTDA